LYKRLAKKLNNMVLVDWSIKYVVERVLDFAQVSLHKLSNLGSHHVSSQSQVSMTHEQVD